MEIDRAQLVELLRSRGDHDLADRVNQSLPPRVETDDHPQLFAGLDLDLDAGDAGRHAESGAAEDMTDLPTSGRTPDEA